jgi:rod shape determining protein RodA
MSKKRMLYFKDFDWFILLLALAICIVGIVEIHSATQFQKGGKFYLQPMYKQIYWIVLGLMLLVLVASIDYHTIGDNVPYIYVLAILALLAVLVIGQRVSGSKSWITLGAFKIQPSEFVKIAIVLTLARYLGEMRTEYLGGRDIIKASILMGIPFGLVMLQPDLGSAVTLMPILAMGLFLGGLRSKWIITSVILFTLVLGLGWYNLKDYQKDRIYTFLNPENDPLGRGYHAIQSKIAVGSGGLFGKGVNKGSQTELGFLPERQTDFIFSVIGEELGFVGTLGVLTCYFLIIMRSVHIAQTARDKLGIYIAMGAVSIILFHIFVNIGMVVGIMPITGIPLPLLSYGGSSILSTFVLLGLIINVRMRRYVN